MAKFIVFVAVLGIAGCATIQPRNAVICNDVANVSACPDSTANVVVGM